MGPFDGEKALDSPRSRCLPRLAWVQGSQEEKLLGLALHWLCTPRRRFLSAPMQRVGRLLPARVAQVWLCSVPARSPGLQLVRGALLPGGLPGGSSTSTTPVPWAKAASHGGEQIDRLSVPRVTGRAGHDPRRALPWCGGSRWVVNAEAQLPWVTQLLVAPKPDQVCGRWAGD